MAIENYHNFTNRVGSEKCLEIKKLNRLKDKETLETIRQYISINSLEELRSLSKTERDTSLRLLKSIDGLSIYFMI